MNKTITRTLCVLLALVLMSSTAVSYTYAEYARGVSVSDSGRATTWGVSVSLTGASFATKYVTDVTYEGIDVAVKSSTTDDIVAPGTTGTFTGIRCTGTPEVGVNITITPDLQLTNWSTTGSDYYCPIEITINGTKYSGMSYASSAAFETAVENAIKASAGYYAPGTNLANISGLNGDYTWTWQWSGATGQTDAKDLLIGERAGAGTKANIALSVSCSVIQVD